MANGWRMAEQSRGAPLIWVAGNTDLDYWCSAEIDPNAGSDSQAKSGDMAWRTLMARGHVLESRGR